MTARTTQQLSTAGSCAHDTVCSCWPHCPSHKFGSHRLFDGLICPSWHRFSHGPCKMDTCKRRLLFNNPILNRKFVPTDCSMVYLPRPDIASHISLAKWTPVNDAFLFNNTILTRKLVPTDCSMIYLVCRHVTSYMPIASGTNVVILFRTGASVPDSEIVTACAAVIDLACSYSTVYRLLAMRTHVLENLAFGHGFCCLRWPHRPLPSVAVVLLAMYLCRPFCGHFCSVLLSALFCLWLCFLPLGALLFSIPFSFRDGIPDIGDGACLFSSAALLATFACVAATRCTLCWCFPGEWGTASSCYRLGHHYKNDVAPAKIQKRTLLALPCRRCISTSPMLYPNNLNTLYRPCVLVSRPRQKISFRPCAYCKHYTLVSVRTSYKYDKMWLVALHVLSWMHLPVSTPCRPCIATAAAHQRAYECIPCILSPHLLVSIDQPWMQTPALLHYILCIVFRLGISLAARSNPFFHHPEPQQQFPPYFCPFLKWCCRERSVHKQTIPVLDSR